MRSGAEILAALWRDVGGAPEAPGKVALTGAEPVLPSSFRVDIAAQTTIAAAALAAIEIGRARGLGDQGVAVDMRHAAVEFQSERHLQIDGGPAPELWDTIAGIYRCRDGWVRLHTNFRHHRDGVLALLRCDATRDAVGAALRAWRAAEFEEEANRASMVVAMLRDAAGWSAHAQGAAVAAQPLVAFTRIGDAPASALPPLPEARPLAGLRVLDLTRIIAGPVCGRVLAAHGADVLSITAAHLPSIPVLVIDTGRGKRSAQLDLREEAGKQTLRALIREADVFVEGYRPGALAALGFAPNDIAALRPGIVVASLSAYGEGGPWARRRGFDSLVQTASGFNDDEMRAAGDAVPRPLPCQALDHASGYLLALGALRALSRRRGEGGSWHVRVSLARTGLWLRALGRVEDGFAVTPPDRAAIADLLETSDSGFGRLTAVRHAAQLSRTPAQWRLPSVELGTHAPEWPPRA
jgi:crotonobetainyl-CoA:carnitine CoA-transferase CaiB-like acyl-CoA transferase